LLDIVEKRKLCGARSVRRYREIAPLFDGTKEEDFDAYYMFREATEAEDLELYRQEGLRYDVTELPPGLIGDEFIKTAGHFHPLRQEREMRWPELYQVVRGRALFILQRSLGDGELEVCAVHMGPGDVMLIPGDYGHVMTNIGEENLLSANIVSAAFASEYEEYQVKRGAAVKCGVQEGAMFLRQNPAYEQVISIKELTAMEFARETGEADFILAVVETGDIYRAFLSNPEAFRFLA